MIVVVAQGQGYISWYETPPSYFIFLLIINRHDVGKQTEERKTNNVVCRNRIKIRLFASIRTL